MIKELIGEEEMQRKKKLQDLMNEHLSAYYGSIKYDAKAIINA